MSAAFPITSTTDNLIAACRITPARMQRATVASATSTKPAKRARPSPSEGAATDCKRHERHVQEAQTALNNIRADAQHYGVLSGENERLRKLLYHYREGLDKARDVANSRQRIINGLVEESKDLELKKADAVAKAKKEAEERHRVLANSEKLRKDFNIRERMLDELQHSLRGGS
jgi:predicted AAA+ superfamily ATPase